MIITCKPRISFLWIILATLPWVAVIFKDKVMGPAFTLSMRKFVENPAALTFLLTLPAYISWIVPPTVNFLADRIWTRFGRRKPFIIVAWIGTITMIFLMPLAPSFGWLLAAYMGFAIFNDLAGPVESLKMEIVPPAQRATSQAVLSWVGQVAVLVFWVVAIGRFDEMTVMFNLPINGEQGMFWAVSIGMVVMLLFVMLGIKETNPHSALRGEKFNFRTIFRGLFSRHLWPVYILVLSVGVLGTGLGALNTLLTIEQWGYTPQQMGTNIMVGGIINLFLIPVLGLLANKVGRGRVYVALVIANIVVNLSMYLYYNFVLYDARPTLIEMIVFGEMMSVIGILTGMALTPFQYDFIPRNELGTFAAGSSLVNKVTGLVTANLMGLFVWVYASMFLGPPGELARVTLRDDTPKATVQAILDKAAWNNPADGKPLAAPKLTARPWYATGAALSNGRGYEIRLRDYDSAALRDQRDLLEAERGGYRARKSYNMNRYRQLTKTPLDLQVAAVPVTDIAGMLRDPRRLRKELLTRAEAAAKAVKPGATPAEKFASKARAEAEAEAILTGGVKAIDDELESRANAFRKQLETVLGERLLREGEQILAAAAEPALVATYPLKGRPERGGFEKTVDRIRKENPRAVDMRVVQSGDTFVLAVCATTGSGDKGAVVESISRSLALAADKDMKDVLVLPLATPDVKELPAIQLDLRILEDPLDRHLSPITRVVNTLLSVVVTPATPEQRLNAFGRNLRKPGTIDYAGVTTVPGDDHAVRIVATVTPPKPAADVAATATAPTTATAETQAATKPAAAREEAIPEAVAARLAALVPADAAAANLLYTSAVPAAKEQRMTIARPVLTAAFGKQQYDYLAGYIAVFVMQLIGLAITFYFMYLVRKGKVRRRGAEEAEAIR